MRVVSGCLGEWVGDSDSDSGDENVGGGNGDKGWKRRGDIKYVNGPPATPPLKQPWR